MLKMNLITQKELYRELCGELYGEFYRELYGEVWGEIRWELGIQILTDFSHSKFQEYNRICYK
jgi:hypothetical protein